MTHLHGMHIEKIKLIYYSPTGTSEKTVKAIQKGLGTDYETINLTLPDSEMKQYNLKETDLAIIAAPVYSARAQLGDNT
jgi:flavodoxin